MYSKARTFSHIYVEEEVREHPRTLSILERFPKCSLVVVDDYQNVFGRGRQDFWRQKSSPKLILARKKEHFLYPGNDFLQSNLSRNFCYNALVLNCPYDCHYCYLQGMYGTANIVAFVNLEDYFEEATRFINHRPDPHEAVPLAISYDSDLLALEGILGYVREWVEWSRGEPDVLVEVRTKSASSRFFQQVTPSPQVRIAWTLSPETVCSRYEAGAPALPARLKALNEAVEAGWRVSVCIDPMLRFPGWKEAYAKFHDQLSQRLPWKAIERVELGVFRMSTSHFRRMQKRPGTDLLHYPYEHGNNAVSYNEEERKEIMDFLSDRLKNNLSEDKILLWT